MRPLLLCAAATLLACAGAEQVPVERDALIIPDGLDGSLPEAWPEGAISLDIIFVSKARGQDAPGCGTEPSGPCKTISYGVARAAASSPPLTVKVAAGLYLESVELADGVSIYGGYRDDFQEGPGAEETIIQGASIGGQSIAMRGEVIRAKTEIAFLTVRASNAENAGGSSYGILLAEAPGILLHKLKVSAGDGARGEAGSPGAKGENGKSGGPGRAGGDFLWIPPFTCGSTDPLGMGGYGPGGASNCGVAGGRGGLGDGFSVGGECDGENGQGAGDPTKRAVACNENTVGFGGKGGKGGGENAEPDCEGTVTSTRGTDGTPGCPGKAGTNGALGVEAQASGTVDGSGLYQGAHGGDGKPGSNGSGGGGGGGGGGYYPICGTSLPDWGGGGGGGGAGGCGGRGGKGGRGGGGSFGVMIAQGSATIRILDCHISSGKGGAGGNAGAGGALGAGGAGGVGGDNVDKSGKGGRGGKGGQGGKGGDGAGGGGGPSIGVATGKGPLPTISGTAFELGTGGSGGSGAGAAAAGAPGIVAETHAFQ